jgi:hypothetical protein
MVVHRAPAVSEPLFWWLVGSVGVHGMLLAGALAVAVIRPPAAPEPLYTVELESPRGTLQGEVNGRGTPLPVRAAMAPPKAAAPSDAPHNAMHEPVHERKAPLPTDPQGVLPVVSATTKASKESPVAKEKDDALRDAVRNAMLAPPEGSPVQGTGTAAPLGDPQGTPGGKGKGSGVSSAYASVLSGWFASRLHCKGLNLPWEEMKALNVRANVRITASRNVASFSISGSGNSTYDGCVQTMLQSLVSQGTTLPESPEGEDPPPSMTLNFHCRNKDQCS